MEFIRFDISFWLSIYVEVNLIIDVCQGKLPETSHHLYSLKIFVYVSIPCSHQWNKLRITF